MLIGVEASGYAPQVPVVVKVMMLLIFWFHDEWHVEHSNFIRKLIEYGPLNGSSSA